MDNMVCFLSSGLMAIIITSWFVKLVVQTSNSLVHMIRYSHQDTLAHTHTHMHVHAPCKQTCSKINWFLFALFVRPEFGNAALVSFLGGFLTAFGGLFLSCRRCRRSQTAGSINVRHLLPTNEPRSNYV